MINIFRFLNPKGEEVISEGNYSRAAFFYKTKDNREFSISENGWHLVSMR